MIALFHLVMQAADEAKKTANPIISLAPILLIGLVFYFLLIRPQQRKAKAQRELTQTTEVGDEVVTIGGLFGVVGEVDDDSVLLEVAPGIQLRFLRSAIARKLMPEDEVSDDDIGDTDDADEDDDAYLAPDDEFGKDAGAEDKK
jgi:preprotein translocase subunit YajC